MVEKKATVVKAIKGGMLIDGTGAEPISNATVVIEGSKIKAVGRNVAIPPAAEVIDAKGKTVMPGLIDPHLHFPGTHVPRTKAGLARNPELQLIEAISEAKRMLPSGLTTVKSCGGMNGIFLRKAVAEGTLTGLPRIVAAGYLLSQTAGRWDYPFDPPQCVDAHTTQHAHKHTVICDGVDECIKAVRSELRVGADFIKICTGDLPNITPYPQFNLDEIKAIVETAGDAGLFVSAHNEGQLVGMKRSILGGVKTIDHAAVTNDEIVDLAKQKGTIFVSTLEVLRRLGLAEDVPDDLKYAAKRFGPWVEPMYESYSRIRKAGAVLAIGTDYPEIPGFGMLAKELAAMVKYCGFTPMDAIVGVTRNAAMACYIGDKTGTIEPGKFADIIIVDGDPLADIKILQDVAKIKMVMLEGKVEVTR
ncbi:MAG: amidohydrolase family protein [Chloroflexi bacterium]|nr:amidohydrolase family protein [Chloroflexota bacterium]